MARVDAVAPHGAHRDRPHPIALAAALLALTVIANAPHILFNRGAPSFELMVHYR